MTLRLTLALFLLAIAGRAQSVDEIRHPHLWAVSIAAVAAAGSADLASSLGKHETNPVLAGPGGCISPVKAIGVKAGGQAVLLLAEALIIRKHPRTARVFAVINFTDAAVTGLVALHNRGVPKAGHL